MANPELIPSGRPYDVAVLSARGAGLSDSQWADGLRSALDSSGGTLLWKLETPVDAAKAGAWLAGAGGAVIEGQNVCVNCLRG